MMVVVLELGALALLLTIAFGLLCLLRESGGINGFLAILLFGTTGVGMILILSESMDLAGLKDVALAIALLAGILGVVLALRCWPGKMGD